MYELFAQLAGTTLIGGALIWLAKISFEKALATKLQLESERISLLRHQDLEYKAAQIERLYGPLYGLLKTNRTIYDLWMRGELKGANLKVKKLFQSNSEAANELIINNAHLIDEVLMPDSFIRFCTSTQVWSMYCADTEAGSLPEHLSEHPDIKWCQEFEDYIFSKYAALSMDLLSLYRRYEIK